MSLSDEQFEFGKDVQKLLAFIIKEGDKFTFGETQRPQQIQNLYFYGFRVEFVDGIPKLVSCKRKSKKKRSKHAEKLAIDLNLFKIIKEGFWNYISGPLQHKKAFQKYGDYWESLNPKNKWGGNWAKIVIINGREKLKGFYDGPHFERKI